MTKLNFEVKNDKVEKTFTVLKTGKFSKTPQHIWSLYGGDVKIGFMPNSHRYKILEVKGKTDAQIEKLNKTKSSGTSAPGYVDKSRQLIPWATRMYTEKMEELMGDGVSFTRDDLKMMLPVAQNAHDERKKEAGNIGTIAHQFAEDFAILAIEKQIKFDEETGEYGLTADIMLQMNEKLKTQFETEFPDWDDAWPKALKSIQAFIAWVQKYRPQFRQPEQLCYSIKNNHLGLYDIEFELLEKWVGKEMAGLYLGDNKTSNGIYPEHEYQLSSYFKGREEEEEYVGNKDFKYVGGAIMAFYKEDKFTKAGDLVHSAGDFVFKIIPRGELVTAYKVYKATMVIEEDVKRRDAIWRENQKSFKK